MAACDCPPPVDACSGSALVCMQAWQRRPMLHEVHYSGCACRACGVFVGELELVWSMSCVDHVCHQARTHGRGGPAPCHYGGGGSAHTTHRGGWVVWAIELSQSAVIVVWVLPAEIPAIGTCSPDIIQTSSAYVGLGWCGWFPDGGAAQAPQKTVRSLSSFFFALGEDNLGIMQGLGHIALEGLQVVPIARDCNDHRVWGGGAGV